MSDKRFDELVVSSLKRDEGLRLRPYKDSVGILTIGYGRNLEEVGLSPEEAEMLLQHDISSAHNSCISLFGLNVWTSINQDRKAALVNMMFNLGYPRFRKFKNMRKAILDDDWQTAADEAENSKWFTQVGNRAVRIVKALRTGVFE